MSMKDWNVTIPVTFTVSAGTEEGALKRARAAAARALRDVRRAARLADMAAIARATGQEAP